MWRRLLCLAMMVVFIGLLPAPHTRGLCRCSLSSLLLLSVSFEWQILDLSFVPFIVLSFIAILFHIRFINKSLVPR